jgi:hypothetical protein
MRIATTAFPAPAAGYEWFYNNSISDRNRPIVAVWWRLYASHKFVAESERRTRTRVATRNNGQVRPANAAGEWINQKRVVTRIGRRHIIQL